PELRLGRFQVLIAYVDLSFQTIEQRVVEDFPPVPSELLVIGLRLSPGPGLLKRRGHWNGWLMVFRTDGASCDEKQNQHKKTGCRCAERVTKAVHRAAPFA